MRLLRGGLRISMGSRIPGRFAIAGIVALAFGIGIGAGWGSALVAGLVAKVLPSAHALASPSASVSGTPNADIPVDLYPKLTRFMNADDRAAGLASLDIPVRGDGNLTVVSGKSDLVGTGPTRYVRLEIEDGLPIDPDVVTPYVMSILGNAQGWTAHGRVSFARTDGVADIRIVFASPKTAKALCERPHDAAISDVAPPDVPPAMTTASPSATAKASSPSPSASVSASPSVQPSCADLGIVVISAYQWAAGIKAFGDDTLALHDYMINHAIGHILGESDAKCGGNDQLAPVMENQELDITPCKPNGWPFPAS
jgi:hypothetical protein